MNLKRIGSAALALVLTMSMAACAKQDGAPTSSKTDDKLTDYMAADSQIKTGIDGQEVEVNVSDVHMDSYEASTSGKWEAMFTPVEVEGRAIDMVNFDLTPTAEEKAAMEKEPAYGKPVNYYMSDGCTSGPTKVSLSRAAAISPFSIAVTQASAET